MNRFQNTFCHSYKQRKIPTCLPFLCLVSCKSIFVSAYMWQLVWWAQSPVSFRAGRKTTKIHELAGEKTEKGGKTPPEAGRAVHANNGVSVVGVSGLPGYPGSRDMMPQHCRSRTEAPAPGLQRQQARRQDLFMQKCAKQP